MTVPSRMSTWFYRAAGKWKLNMNNTLLAGIFLLLAAAIPAQAEMSIPVQLRVKSPSGLYPTESGVAFRLLVLSPGTNCILREENFSGQEIVNGNVNLSLGTGVLGSNDPALTLNQVFDNSTSKNNLDCVDANNNVIQNNQTYSPAADAGRALRVITTISSEPISVSFNMRAVPYAIQAESVGGKRAADILVTATGTQVTQTNLNNLLADATRLNNLLNLAINGESDTSVDFSGSLTGDVSGTQTTTSVDRIKGVAVSTTAPTTGQVMQYNGTQWAPSTLPGAPVTSVAGRTGDVVLTSADVSGLGSAAGLNAGSAAGQVLLLDGSAKIPVSTVPTTVLNTSTAAAGDVSGTFGALVVDLVGAKTATQVANTVDAVTAATNSNTASAIVRRDASGNVAVSNISTTSASTRSIYIFESSNTNSVRLQSPAAFADYVLTLPVDDGTANQVLTTDGSGVLSWGTPNAGTVTSVTASAPLSSSGGSTPNITISQASGTTPGYLASGDWTTFNNKQNALGYTPLNAASNLSDLGSATTARSNLGLGGAAVLNVGTAAGTVAAGDDSRITGALSVVAFNAYVASANCTTSQTMYWNSVSSTFLCQSINFPSPPVTTVAGRSGDVTLASADISGLGSAAGYAAGTTANQVLLLDGFARMPASALPTTALTTSSTISGDVTGTLSATSVEKIRGVAVSSTAPVTGDALVYNGTQWVPSKGFPAFVKLSSDETFSSVTPASVTGMSFPVVNGVSYKYKFHVLYTSSQNTNGLRIGLSYPSVAWAAAQVEIPNAASSTEGIHQGSITASGGTVVAANTPTAGTIYLATIEGMINPSSGGNVQLLAGVETGAADIVVRAGSYIEITTLP